jgi:dTDP-4-amino-4,6-dideoxygalactose transaminase
MTFCGSANPILYQGARPVFIDSERETWNMDPELLEKAIIDRVKNRQKPKAIIYVHLYGMPAKVKEIQEVADRYQIPLIEDAAEALGSKYLNVPLGRFGDLSFFSFNGNKIITTSGGGALVSSEKKYIEKAKFLSTQARDPAPHYEHSELGYNYRLSNISAAIGIGQLNVLDERVRRRREIYDDYLSALNHSGNIEFLEEPEGYYSNRWLTTILLPNSKMRDAILQEMDAENIEARPLWKPMHLQPLYEHCTFYGSNIAEDLFERGLCLPSGTNITEEEQERIIEIVLTYI